MFDVYCHTSPSGKRYVGFSSQGIDARWRDHVKVARAAPKGKTHALHHAIRKYGADAFTHEVLERTTTEAGAQHAEQLWIAQLGTFGAGGYNLTIGGEGSAGRVVSSEVRAKLSASVRGFTHTPEAREKISAAQRGRPSGMRGRKHTEESREKIAAFNRGRPATAGMTGRKHSAETLAKMSATHSERKPVSAETRKKMAESARARCARRNGAQ